MTKPTLAFATVCKNEEHIIEKCLDSVAPYINYLIVVDTGSTDKTLEIVKRFIAKTQIPAEIFHDEWESFDKNKTKMMQYAFGKTDYVMHFDADDLLIGDFSFNNEDAGYDYYSMSVKRGGSSYSTPIIYNNRLKWKFCGVAHTWIKCLDKQNISQINFRLNQCYILSEDVGARSKDQKKYLRDAEKLQKQFWDTLYDDPDGLNSRSIFYTAQSYMDYAVTNNDRENIINAIRWNRLYTYIKNNWIEETFEAHLRISKCLMLLNENFDKIKNEIDKSIAIFPDRAEPYFYFGIYCNGKRENGLAYDYLMKAKNISLESAKSKYILFVNNYCYGKYINDELSVACYWTGKYQEGLRYLLEIIDDPEFSHHKNRLEDNRQHFNKKMLELGIR